MRNQKGITLIALVITIIVLLILAGVAIAMLSGENGILSRATETKATNAVSTAKEEAKLAYMTVRTEIASKMTKNGNYNPVTNVLTPDKTVSATDKTLEKAVQDDLNFKSGATSGWTSVSGTSEGVITMVYTDDSIKNKAGAHTLTFTISMKTTTPYADFAEDSNNV